jgi:hypothetical protein
LEGVTWRRVGKYLLTSSRGRAVSPKHQEPLTRQHSVTYQKTCVFMYTAVTASFLATQNNLRLMNINI